MAAIGLGIGLPFIRRSAGESIAPPVNIDPPTTNGSNGALVGQVISASTPGNWTNSPTSYSYRWLRNGDAILPPGTDEYELTIADMQADIRVGVVATNAAGSSDEALSEIITPAGAFVTPASAPNAAGDNGQVAPSTITTDNGTWETNPPGASLSFTYQWRQDGVTNGGAGTSYHANTPGNYDAQISADSGYATGNQVSNTVTITES